MSMTSKLRETLPVKHAETKASELKAKVSNALIVVAGKMDATVFDLIATLLLVLSFIHKFPWYVYATMLLVELALIRSSNIERERRFKERIAAIRAKAAK